MERYSIITFAIGTVFYLEKKIKWWKLSHDCLCVATVIKFHLFSREQRKKQLIEELGLECIKKSKFIVPDIKLAQRSSLIDGEERIGKERSSKRKKKPLQPKFNSPQWNSQFTWRRIRVSNFLLFRFRIDILYKKIEKFCSLRIKINLKNNNDNRS